MRPGPPRKMGHTANLPGLAQLFTLQSWSHRRAPPRLASLVGQGKLFVPVFERFRWRYGTKKNRLPERGSQPLMMRSALFRPTWALSAHVQVYIHQH